MKMFIRLIKIIFVILLTGALLLGCCIPQSAQGKLAVIPQITPTITESQIQEPAFLQNMTSNANKFESVPDLWTKINREKITLYPINRLADYTYAKDGSLWLVGGFGVIHQETNGQQKWYSIKNELPINFFTTVAISPIGEVWVGGVDNALFRFDGSRWIDEGIKLPLSYDTSENWLCYSKDIAGIDFDDKGNVWVMNAGIDVYTQVYGQWLNFPFPKNILPIAGGGACPQGIRVRSATDITIKRSGCCENPPIAYHFNGSTWTTEKNYSAVDQLIESRHKTTGMPIMLGSLGETELTKWPFEKKLLLPEDFYLSGSSFMMTDENGNIWLTDRFYLYNNLSGEFDGPLELNVNVDPSITDSKILNFGGQIIYYQKGRRPFNLAWVLDKTSIGWYDGNAALDDQNRVWAYIPDKGLVIISNGIPRILSKNDELTNEYIGGILPLDSEQVLIGSRQAIWKYKNDHWQKIIIPSGDQLIKYIVEDSKGVIYGATDTGVYEIHEHTFTSVDFEEQDSKPWVVSADGELSDCSFNRNYTVVSNCLIVGTNGSATHFSVKLLATQDDGSVIYVNNKIIAKLQNGTWKSFLFDRLEIQSATVGNDGSIWVFAGKNGILRFSPDIFDDYQGIKTK